MLKNKPLHSICFFSCTIIAVIFACFAFGFSAIENYSGIDSGPQAKKTDKAVLMFAGDLMCSYEMQKSAMIGDAFAFNAGFNYVKPILELSDLAIGALETVISQTAPYMYEQAMIMSPGGMQYNCNAPAAFLDALAYAGFGVVVTANNHNLDAGLQGIAETLDNLDSCHLPNTGMFRQNMDSRFLLFDINGINIAILSYATAFNTFDGLYNKQALDICINKYGQNKARADIAAAKMAGADFIIVFIHWGKQNSVTVTNNQYLYGQELADAGADYIVGGHPHVLNPYDVLHTADGRNVPVIYSLGNFFTDMNEVAYINSDAVIWRLELEKSADGVRIADEGYIPCYIFQNFEGQRCVTVPCDSVLANMGAISELNDARERIRRSLGDKICEINLVDSNL
jgi:poly-gamma-glutamate synthesis protein (capsule biosynthesis protein)